MRILFIAPRYHTNLHFRIKALQESGHEVVFLSQYKGQSERYDAIEPKIIGFSPLYLFLDNLLRIFFKKETPNLWKLNLAWPRTSSLKKEIKDFSPDVIIVKGMKSVLSLIALWLAKRSAARSFFLLQIRNHYANTPAKKIVLWFIKNILKAEGIISEIDNENNKHDPFYHYIPFATEVKDFEKKYFKDDKINIIGIGKFVERKAHLDLLKAIKKLRSKYDFNVTIVGERSDEKVLNMVKQHIESERLGEIVDLRLNLSNQEVLNEYKKNDLFVLSSYNEPASYSVLEAMANKLPVICSDTNGTKCYIKEGENGYIFRSKNSDSLKNMIDILVNRRGNIVRMGKLAFDHVTENFSEEKFIANINKLLNKDA